MQTKAQRTQWWLSLSPEQQRAHVKKIMAAKAKKRTPAYRRKIYRQRGYTEEEIAMIMLLGEGVLND